MIILCLNVLSTIGFDGPLAIAICIVSVGKELFVV